MTESIPFDCAQFNPHDGPFMLDNVTVTSKVTRFYFTEDLGTRIQARPLGEIIQ